MADNQPHPIDIERARELLSPYLDDEVSDEERALVEQAVATSSVLRQELETLRQTISLVAALPQAPAPRPFTLSEADIQPARPTAGRGFFGLPVWFRGWAIVAATLLCVLAVGGVFLSQMLGNLAGNQAAEIAFRDEGVASQAEAVEEAAQEMEAPGEAIVTPAEEVEQEITASEPAAEKEELLEAEEPAAEEAAEDEISSAGEVAQEEAEPAESQAAPESEAASGAIAGNGEVGVEKAAGATASPLPVAGAAATPMAKAVEEERALAVEEAAPSEAGAAESAPATDLDDTGQTKLSEPNELTLLPRSVEIQNQVLRVAPGLISLEGIIEADQGTKLLASLLRNGETFDDWAEPSSRQSLVQPDGQFSLAIRAKAGRTDADLFEVEPANYEIIIRSVETDMPVMASVFFDTFGVSAATEQPTAPPAPQPSPTVVAQATMTPLPSPTEAAPAEIGAEQSSSQARPIRVLVVGLALVGALIIIGFVIWLVIRKLRG